ncbi:hypothetical protein IQ62_04170 [Streptomyces scabiei]|nr:hypothetical protein IQ62_04170 [Streptomyces scabiei]
MRSQSSSARSVQTLRPRISAAGYPKRRSASWVQLVTNPSASISNGAASATSKRCRETALSLSVPTATLSVAETPSGPIIHLV